MLLTVTSEAVMCLSFPFMQLTLSSHQLLPYPHLQLTPQHPDVMAFVGAFLLTPQALLVRSAFACLDNILCKSCSVVKGKVKLLCF